MILPVPPSPPAHNVQNQNAYRRIVMLRLDDLLRRLLVLEAA